MNSVEVWLRQADMKVSCLIYNDDESGYPRDTDSPSLRGAQREVSAYFIRNGFKPDGGWTVEATESGRPVEAWRTFKHAA